MIGTSKPKVLAEFYEKVLDKKPDWTDGGWYGWQIGDTHFTIGEHSEVKGIAKEPQRIILNLETDKVKEEFERIKAHGAKVVRKPYAMTQEGEAADDENGMLIATFADPDGNYFQLMSPWDSGMN
jgi:predicted enzyme related to lactoylglutathione lyase